MLLPCAQNWLNDKCDYSNLTQEGKMKRGDWWRKDSSRFYAFSNGGKISTTQQSGHHGDPKLLNRAKLCWQFAIGKNSHMTKGQLSGMISFQGNHDGEDQQNGMLKPW